MYGLLLSYYGDDFTGSTDALEFIARAGAKAVLFTEMPSMEQIREFPGLNVFGVAGKTRSLPPGEMENALLPAFQQMKAMGPRHVHYKVCSTFDSSSKVGSIGKAIDCGARIFEKAIIPILGGMPALGRYCVFGNLFAKMGIGSNGAVFRLDRHPSMSRHPVTPSDESDLRLHLSKQTGKKIGLINMLQLDQPPADWMKSVEEHDEPVLVDAMNDAQMEKIGEWLELLADQGGPLFSVGASGIEFALGRYWNGRGLLKPATEWKKPGRVAPILVISGSCSPVTQEQISWALANGFEEVQIDPAKVCDEGTVAEAIPARVIELLSHQKSLVVHTGKKEGDNFSSERLGTALGQIAHAAAKSADVKRIVVAGGDTSSYAARAMSVDAVEMLAPIVPGAPLCKVHSKDRAIDGIEVNFKGGQVGAQDYFGVLLEGTLKTNADC